jgi:hypothetical protein
MIIFWTFAGRTGKRSGSVSRSLLSLITIESLFGHRLRRKSLRIKEDARIKV